MKSKSPLLLITQRVIANGPGGYRSDVLDQAWASFLDVCGIRALAVPNSHPNPKAFLAENDIQGLIFTGGNNISQLASPEVPLMEDLAPERDRTELELLAAATKANLPVIGICRGMQLLNVFYGGKIAQHSGHVRVNHCLKLEPDFQKICGATDISTNSFHNMGISEPNLAKPLKAWAHAEDGTVEAFRHTTLPHFGIMWHPEREPKNSDFNLKIFQHIWSLR